MLDSMLSFLFFEREDKNYMNVWCVSIGVRYFGIVSEAEVDVFLELSCFFYDPMDVGNLISGAFCLF